MKSFLLWLAALWPLLTPVSAQPGARPLVVATYAYDGNDRLASIGPLAEALARSVGRPARLRSFPSVPALLAAVQAGQVDVALLNTLGFLALQAEVPAAVKPLARLQAPEQDANAYRACLLGRKAAGVAALAAVPDRAAGLRLVFAGEHSTSGHLVARLLLATQGLDSAEARFGQVSYAGSHAAVLRELRAGRADLGACGLGEFRQLAAQGQAGELELLWTSEAIPLGPVVCRAALPAAEQRALQQVLLGAHQAQPAALEALRQGWAEARSATQFVPVLPYEYEAFFRLVDTDDERVHGLAGRGPALRRLLADYVR